MIPTNKLEQGRIFSDSVFSNRVQCFLYRGGAGLSTCGKIPWYIIYTIIKISFSEANIHSMVEVLLKYGANPCQQNATGWTSLHSAAKRGNVDIMTALLQKGVSDINITNCKGKTPLMAAVEENKVQIIRSVANLEFLKARSYCDSNSMIIIILVSLPLEFSLNSC